jgi:hypothetical protein
MRLHLRRGFTAVEFMVAVTAGLAVSVAAYTLSKSSVEVFQQEARLNAAQFSSMMGMNRLSADIKRAGFQTTPEVAADPNVCVIPPDNNFPDPNLLVAARVIEGGPFNANVAYTGSYAALPGAFGSATNKRSPDRLRLSANFGASSSFRISRMENDFVWLDIDQLSVQRIYQAAQSGGFGICSAFEGLPVPDNTGAQAAPGGQPAVRLVDNAGRSRFALITSCASTDGGATNNYASVMLRLQDTPEGPGCTAMDVTSPGYVNPVQFVDYALFGAQDVAANAATIGLPAPIGTMAGEDAALEPITGANSRAFLVRRELDGRGNLVPASAEVVADFVVDLNFSARRRVGAGVQPVPFDGLAGIPPNEIRSLGIRLSTRARNPDRAVGQAVVPDSDQTLTRFDVFAGASNTRERWARVRTMFSEVSLPNLQGDAF